MIELANKYTKVSCYGWSVKKKPKPLGRKERVKRNQKSTWAKGGLASEDIHSGDLLTRMYEETDKALERNRYPGQEDFKQAEKRMGKLMLSSDFIRKVLKLNKNLIYEDSVSYKGCGAFYLKQGKTKKSLNAAFRLGWMPEWTIMKTDRADLPTRAPPTRAPDGAGARCGRERHHGRIAQWMSTCLIRRRRWFDSSSAYFRWP